jgi:excisionase family DNA binding protein
MNGDIVDTPPSSRDRLLTISDLAVFLRVPRKTIYQWRYRGQGPRALTPGERLVRYRMKDVLEWLEKRRP